MNALIAFAIQFLVPLCIGAAVSYYLRDVLGRLLLELCGTIDRAQFWVRLMSVTTTVTPIFYTLLVPVASSTSPTRWENGAWVPGTDNVQTGAFIGEVLHHTITMSLCGVLFSLGILVFVIASKIPSPAGKRIAQPLKQTEQMDQSKLAD